MPLGAPAAARTGGELSVQAEVDVQGRRTLVMLEQMLAVRFDAHEPPTVQQFGTCDESSLRAGQRNDLPTEHSSAAPAPDGAACVPQASDSATDPHGAHQRTVRANSRPCITTAATSELLVAVNCRCPRTHEDKTCHVPTPRFPECPIPARSTWRARAIRPGRHVAGGRWAIDAARSTLAGIRYGSACSPPRMGRSLTSAGTWISPWIRRQHGGGQVGTASSDQWQCLHGLAVARRRPDRQCANPAIGFVSRALRASTRQTWLLDGLLATDSAVLDVTLDMMDPVRQDGAFLFRAKGRLPSREAVRLLSHPGVERVLGKTMALDLTVVAMPGPARTVRVPEANGWIGQTNARPGPNPCGSTRARLFCVV